MDRWIDSALLKTTRSAKSEEEEEKEVHRNISREQPHTLNFTVDRHAESTVYSSLGTSLPQNKEGGGLL